MENDILSRDWDLIRSQVRERWPALSEDDLETIDGGRDILMALLQEKYGYACERAEYEIERFLYDIASRQTVGHMSRLTN